MASKFACSLAAFALGFGSSMAAAQQTVTVTTTPDFRSGNNEGLISPAQDRITRDRITAGTVGTWTASTAFPSVRGQHSCVAYNGYFYVCGGQDSGDTSTSEVLMAPINVDGTIGSWSATTALPSARGYHSSVAYNGFLYVIGGDTNFGATGTFDEVLVAPINANGTIGTWSTTTALPSGRAMHTSVVFNGFLYAMGGYDTTFAYLGDVLVAPINADGSVGTWSTTTALPSALAHHSSVVYNGFVYIIGGSAVSFFNAVSDVLVAPLNADGTVGTWTATTALPAARAWHGAVAHGGFVYVIGGVDASVAAFSDALVAPINANGTVGTWSTTTALSSARLAIAPVVYEGFAYVMGGFDASLSAINEVVVAPVDPDAGSANQTPSLLRGFYSHYLDQQSDTPSRVIMLNGQLSPGGVIRLQVRVAPDATGVFGTETIVNSVTLGNSIQVSGTGRYVWIRITLDDTATTNEALPTFVTDFTVTATSLPTTGFVFDGPGADIDTQTSTTTIEANWSGFTPGAGDSIAFYEWSIGTAPGLTNVQNWTSVGLATSATNSTLSLSVGFKYVSVRATSTLGLTSTVATSDGVQILPPPSAPGNDDDDKKGRCGLGVSSASNSWLALLGGLAVMGFALRRRRGATPQNVYATVRPPKPS